MAPKTKHNLMILLIDSNAQIVPSADLRYTAGTQDMNSLVEAEVRNDRTCVRPETREPLYSRKHHHEITARGSNRI